LLVRRCSVASGINHTLRGNLYGDGPTISAAASAQTPYSAEPSTGGITVNDQQQTDAGDDHVANAVEKGFAGKPFQWWFVLVALVFALGFASKKMGTDDGDFATVRASFGNILTVSLMAIIGIAFFKVILTKWPVPGLTPIVLAV
jgi:hypothetical protein